MLGSNWPEKFLTARRKGQLGAGPEIRRMVLAANLGPEPNGANNRSNPPGERFVAPRPLAISVAAGVQQAAPAMPQARAAVGARWLPR